MNYNNQSKQTFNSQYFKEKGLNIQAVFNISDLPVSLLKGIDGLDVNTDDFNQLIVIGHLGRELWSCVKQTQFVLKDNPIDSFSVQAVRGFFDFYWPNHKYEILYPGDAVIGLQQLGVLSGWHHASPFKVGINNKWGTWFAYRAVVISKTNFPTTSFVESISPCISCKDQVCISACPANALDNGELNFNGCIDYRKQEKSICKDVCLARVNCPVGSEYRYTDEQINYHYGVSMKTIEEFY